LEEKTVALITLLGIFLWSSLSALTFYSGSFQFGNIGQFLVFPWISVIGGTKPTVSIQLPTPSTTFWIIFSFMIASYINAWWVFVAWKWLIPHGRVEIEDFTYFAAFQALFPPIIILSPLIYYLQQKKRPQKAKRFRGA